MFKMGLETKSVHHLNNGYNRHQKYNPVPNFNFPTTTATDTSMVLNQENITDFVVTTVKDIVKNLTDGATVFESNEKNETTTENVQDIFNFNSTFTDAGNLNPILGIESSDFNQSAILGITETIQNNGSEVMNIVTESINTVVETVSDVINATSETVASTFNESTEIMLSTTEQIIKTSISIDFGYGNGDHDFNTDDSPDHHHYYEPNTVPYIVLGVILGILIFTGVILTIIYMKQRKNVCPPRSGRYPINEKESTSSVRYTEQAGERITTLYDVKC